jgi:hypothetical protein
MLRFIFLNFSCFQWELKYLGFVISTFFTPADIIDLVCLADT